LRIGLMCLLALALARPWAKGGLFSKLTRSTPRDIAVVIDGSYSMGWEGKTVTPHAAAVQWTHELLEELGGGDTVTLLDARDRVRQLTERPTSDFGSIRTLLDALPQPSGTSSLPNAGIHAAQILAQGEHLDREIILLSDGQSLAWSPENGAAWRQFDETLRQSAVSPRVWAVDVAGPRGGRTVNFSVERLKLSRELTVPGFPLRIETTVRQWGGSPTSREVSFAVNGQRLSEKTTRVNLPTDGEAHVTFEHRFDQVGSDVLSVMLESDNLPGDNRSDAAVVVESGIPVLLVDGSRHRDPTLSETFFLSAALTPARSDAPWVMATVIEPRQLSAQTLDGRRAVFLANVPRVTEEQVDLLKAFVAAGGGLVVAPGDLIDREAYNRALYADGRGLLPARFDVIKHEREYQLGDVNIAGDSLDGSWLARFRPPSGVDLAEARFAHWWRMAPASGGTDGPDQPEPATSPAGGIGESTGEHAKPPSNAEPPTPNAEERTPTAAPVITARLDTDDPFLISRSFGEGTVLQLAVPLDGDWTTLPSKNDFVPFVHELVFHLASRKAGRNIEAGMPLVLDVMSGSNDSTSRFLAPDGRTLPAEPFVVGSVSRVGLREADVPGIYRFQPTGDGKTEPEYFVVHSDRRESDLTPLAPPDRERLTEHDRIRFAATRDEIVAGMADDQVPSEMWRMLLFGVLAMLIAEVLLTRRLVQGGHEAIEDEPPA
ncbi:MAG: VWA domain-containing protein, partial [Planctomycetaceae bacterium]